MFSRSHPEIAVLDGGGRGGVKYRFTSELIFDSSHVTLFLWGFMCAMLFDPESLADLLSDAAGFKAGLALSVEEMCDHLSGTRFPDLLRASEKSIVRLRSEEYEELFYKLLHRIGYTIEEFNGDVTGAWLYHKYKDTRLSEWQGVLELFTSLWPGLIRDAVARGSKSIDPRPFIQAAYDKYGRTGLDMAMERLDVVNHALNLSPHSTLRFSEWTSELALSSLFNSGGGHPERGRFIDQRFIDYLSANQDRLGDVHWRKFEELSAEFFHREGYLVELGPGSNDDGVDVRVWRPGQSASENPHCLVQCKRQKAKVEKVVVKGLHADVGFEGADYGLVVTTSELSPGARNTISARGYPIQEINRAGLNLWLTKLRTPGTGIVRA